jgi:hypothetical protein
MSQLASDNFTRADQTPLASPWTDVTFGGNDSFNLASNVVLNPSPAVNDALSIYGGIAWPNDQYSEVTLASPSTPADATIGYGPVVRAATGQTTFYRVTGNGYGWDFSKALAGAFTHPSVGTTTTFANGDQLKLSIVGTTWTIYKNGVSFDSGTDIDIASGSPGIGYSSADAASAGIRAWSGGDFNVATGLPDGGHGTYQQICVGFAS